MLLACGANPNVCDRVNKQTALHVAVMQSQLEVVTALKGVTDGTIRDRFVDSSNRYEVRFCKSFNFPLLVRQTLQ
jgi:hypothetical protein